MAALYLRRQRTGLGATVIARAFNRGPSAVSYAVRSIERLLTEEPALGELLKEVERELQPGAGGPQAEVKDPEPRRPR
jgi:chromosomal replication initiation ATPase DnaA